MPKPNDVLAAAMAEADCRLRMAKVLFAGGLAEEAPATLGKALQAVGQALGLALGEGAAALESDVQIRRFVAMAALPTDALTLLEAANAADASADAVESLIDALVLILADMTRDEPRVA